MIKLIIYYHLPIRYIIFYYCYYYYYYYLVGIYVFVKINCRRRVPSIPRSPLTNRRRQTAVRYILTTTHHDINSTQFFTLLSSQL